MRQFNPVCAGLLAALLVSALAGAEPQDAVGSGKTGPASVGTRLAALELTDQHGQTRRVDAATRVLLFSRDMGGGRLIQKVLETDGAARLERYGAVYVSDVSRMPGLVRRFIAGPKMKRRPYPMLLDEEGEATASLPSQEGRATLLRLEGLEVTAVVFSDTPEALLAALEASPEH